MSFHFDQTLILNHLQMNEHDSESSEGLHVGKEIFCFGSGQKEAPMANEHSSDHQEGDQNAPKRKREDASSTTSLLTIQRSDSISSCTISITSTSDGFDSKAGEEKEKDSNSSGCNRPEDHGRDMMPAPYFYYRDHSTADVTDALSLKNNGLPTFLMKLHNMLNQTELKCVISWLPHGRSWTILNKQIFEDDVLPRFFRAKKRSSFLNNVRRWGFKRMKNGNDKDSFYSEYFLRGLPHLCARMKHNSKTPLPPQASIYEPDLHAISLQRPLPQSMDPGCEEYINRFSAVYTSRSSNNTTTPSSFVSQLQDQHNSNIDSHQIMIPSLHQYQSNNYHAGHGTDTAFAPTNNYLGHIVEGVFQRFRETARQQETMQHIQLDHRRQPNAEAQTVAVVDTSHVLNAICEAFSLGAMYGAGNAIMHNFNTTQNNHNG